MKRLHRLIPVLLLQGRRMVKTTRFQKPVYLGDPVNAVKLFNDKEADELAFVDIDASLHNKPIDFKLVREIADEAFMPLAYGGNIQTVDDVKRLVQTGIEKAIINSRHYDDEKLIPGLARHFGSSTVVAGVDVKRNLLGKPQLVSRHATLIHKQHNLLDYCRRLESMGAGELLVNSVDRDGMMGGYDVKLMQQIAAAVRIPVIALGGAGTLQHVQDLHQQSNVSAFGAGSIFVYKGPHKAVLINYPQEEAVKQLWKN